LNKELIIAIVGILALATVIILEILGSKQRKKEEKRLEKIRKAMQEADKHARIGTREHLEKFNELFEKEN